MNLRNLLAISLTLLASIVPAAARARTRWVSLFNGRDLEGWTTVHPSSGGYLVKDGLLICPAGENAHLFTTREYSDFDFRFDFRMDPGANNGVGIRAPLEGDAAYAGMEIQILDDSAPEYANLKSWQFCGSI